jgi:hypothetical protein
LINGFLAIVGFTGVRYARRTLATLKRQVEVTEPRLHIDCVRAANFKYGQSPVFFVRVINSGIITAENVMIGMEAAIDPGKIVRYQKDQVIAIPADGSRECFIRSEMVLDQNRLAAYDNGDIPLRISGYVKWSGKTAEYCYKYNPWPSGNRPKGVPVFVPCDFETGENTAIKIEAAMPIMSAGLSAVKIEAPSPEAPENINGPN